MKTGIALALALTVWGAAMLGAGTAAAHKKAFPTTVEFIAGEPLPGGTAVLGGLVRTGKKKCRANRPMTLTFVDTNGSRRLEDRGRTSRRGAFMLAGTLRPTTEAVLLKAPKLRLGTKSKRHRHTCKRGRQYIVL